MHIIHVSSELAPIAKAGGLGDVVYGLAQELSRLHHTVEIILPKYDCLKLNCLANLKVEYRDLWSFDGPDHYSNTIWSAQVDGLNILLVEPHHPDDFFNRGMIYGCADDINRFAYFSRTVMEYLYKSGKRPDVIHAHDWPTALTAVLYKEMYIPLGYRTGKTVLTIHNIEHQGRCRPSDLTKIGLHGETYLTEETMRDPSMPNLVNILKGGITYADLITTVSPTYTQEILAPEGGWHLHETLLQHQKKLHGILNGIDAHFWNPATDIHLAEKYEDRSVLAGKRGNRRHLRTHFGLRQTDQPLVASVTRLVPQKGPELIRSALLHTLEKGGQFILLGCTLIPEYQLEFEALQHQFKDDPRIAIVMDYDESLAHLIFAAADMLMIPSLFEPCGLTQMIALRYGTVPIVRLTGGLADTVFDIDTANKPLHERNGFTFDLPTTKEVNGALDRALMCYRENPKKWEALVMNGMKMDFSWKQSARAYLELYASQCGEGK